ncbi:MAG: hypothetical protein IT314_13495 [Anaerolineales bacterium]|nr:hypothetical protein [Anaerolineales bacterium]
MILFCARTDDLAGSAQSVFDQSYADREIFIVDLLGIAGYVDELISSVGRNEARRIFYRNGKAASTLMDEAMQASQGDIICLLNAQDRFHKEKLRIVAAYFEDNPAKKAMCHANFVVSESGKTLSLWRPPSQATLENFFLNDGFFISNIALRRSIVRNADASDGSLFRGAFPIHFVSRLLLSGVEISGVHRVLGDCRTINRAAHGDLPDFLKNVSESLEAIFKDPRCPEKSLGLRDAAVARVRLRLAYEAFIGGDGALGQELLRSSIYLDRSVLDMHAYRFFLFLIVESMKYDDDHAARINRIFDQLPPEMMWMTPYRNEVIARGSALRGVRAVLWGRLKEGVADLSEAARAGYRIDQYFLHLMSNELLDCEIVFGYQAVDSALRVLTPHLKKLTTSAFVRRFLGDYFANRAFREFEKGKYSISLRSIRDAVFAHPAFLTNRGLLATLFRSLGRLRRQAHEKFTLEFHG